MLFLKNKLLTTKENIQNEYVIVILYCLCNLLYFDDYFTEQCEKNLA